MKKFGVPTSPPPGPQAKTPWPRVETEACARCGAPLEPADRFCPACGTAHRPPPLPAQSRRVFQDTITCDNCGATLHIRPDQRSYTCEYCGSTYVLDFAPELTGRQAPEFVLGFAISPDEARQLFLKWMERRVGSAPAAFREAVRRADIRGIYIPFWSFSMLAESQWQATIGEYWYRTETYTTYQNGKLVTKTRTVRETEWWPLAGKYHQYVSGYLVSASRNVPQQVADRLIPFHLAGLRRYDPAYLAGWACEEYVVDRPEAESRCKEYFRQYQEQCVAALLPGDTYRGLVVDTQFSQEASDLILLPIYVMRFDYAGKTYRVWMNGQTGAIAGEVPRFWGRWIIVGLIVLAALLALGFLVTRLWG